MTTIPKVVVERQHLIPRTCEFCFVLFVFKVKIGSKLIMPALGRQRRADVWGSVDNLVF